MWDFVSYAVGNPSSLALSFLSPGDTHEIRKEDWPTPAVSQKLQKVF